MSDLNDAFNLEKLLEFLENEELSEKDLLALSDLTFKQTSTDPNPLMYSSLRKYLAVIAFNKSKPLACAFNFQESLGPAFRSYINKINNYKLNKENSYLANISDEQFECISNNLKMIAWKDEPSAGLLQEDFMKAHERNIKVKKIAENRFYNDMFVKNMLFAHIDSTEIDKMKLLSEGFPADWTIAQITTGPDEKHIVGPSTNFLPNTPIYVTIFTGEHIKDNRPITICVKPPKNGKSILSELLNELEKYKADIRVYNQLVYKRLVKEFEDIFGGVASLLLGKFKSNINDYKLICRDVNGYINEFDLLDEQKILLYRLAAYNSYACSFQSITNALKAILPDPIHAVARQNLAMYFKKYFKSDETYYQNMEKAIRGPTILIIDGDIDQIPWETLKCFQLQSVTRIHSLHLLNRLYNIHKDKIIDGYFTLDNIKGGYILDPAPELSNMRNRVKGFRDYWLPDWINGIMDREPTADDYQNILKSSTIYYYAGHGGGQKFLTFEALEKNDLSCVAILSGCSSVSLDKVGLAAEYGLHLSYHIAGSPCVVGNLWSVSDRDCDTMMARLLSTWIPGPANVKHFTQCNLDKWDKEIIDSSRAPSLKGSNFIGPLYPGILSECDLQKAVSVSRGYCRHYMNFCSVVVRGLPTKLKY